MTVGQKAALSLLVSTLLAAAFALLAFSGLFELIETRFFDQRVRSRIEASVRGLGDSAEAYHTVNRGRFSSLIEKDYIRRSFLANQSAEDLFQRSSALGLLAEETPGYLGVRFIDQEGRRIHFSSFPADALRSEAFRVVYRNYGEEGDPPLEELARGPEASPIIGTVPKLRAFAYAFPFFDSFGIHRGTALFYVSYGGLSEHLLRDRRIGLDETPLQAGEGLVFGSPGFADEAFLARIAELWPSAIAGGAAPLARSGGSDAFVLFARPGAAGPIGRVIPAAAFAFPEALRWLLLSSLYLTAFLVSFLMLNLRQDRAAVLSHRIKQFQLSVIEEYLDKKGELDLERLERELSARRPEVRERMRAGLGSFAKRHAEEVDRLVDKGWDEIIAILAGRQGRAPELDLGRIESLLEEALKKGNLSIAAPAALAPPPAAIAARPNASPVAAAEPVEELEELDELEEAEEAEESDEAGAASAPPVAAAAAADAVEELEELEELDELEEAQELIEPAAPNAEAESAAVPAETIPVAAAEPVEELEELDELEETEEAEEAEESDEAGAASAPPVASSADAVEELEELEELDELEEAQELIEPAAPNAEAESAAVPAETIPVAAAEPVEELEELDELEAADEGAEAVSEIELPGDEVWGSLSAEALALAAGEADDDIPVIPESLGLELVEELNLADIAAYVDVHKPDADYVSDAVDLPPPADSLDEILEPPVETLVLASPFDGVAAEDINAAIDGQLGLGELEPAIEAQEPSARAAEAAFEDATSEFIVEAAAESTPPPSDELIAEELDEALDEVEFDLFLEALDLSSLEGYRDEEGFLEIGELEAFAEAEEPEAAEDELELQVVDGGVAMLSDDDRERLEELQAEIAAIDEGDAAELETLPDSGYRGAYRPVRLAGARFAVNAEELLAIEDADPAALLELAEAEGELIRMVDGVFEINKAALEETGKLDPKLKRLADEVLGASH